MYHFVFKNPKPQSSADRRLAELQDADARSHAAKIAYLKKKAREQDRASSSISSSQDEVAQLAAPKDVKSAESFKASMEERLSIEGQTKTALGHGRPSPAHSKGVRLLPRTKLSVQSLLSQTSRDPFDSYPERRLPENVEKVVQYAFDRIWPDMLCSVRGENLAVAKREWRHHGLDDELLFHVQVALACGLNLALQNVPKVSEALGLARLSHYSKAIRLLKQRIENLDGPASEDLMMSVLILGVNADIESSMPECHPRSPLATSQYMHLYGRLTLMPSYAAALEQLVRARGGISALKHLALPDWLLLADLHHASRTGDRLLYPRIRPYHSIVSSGRHVLDAKATLLSEKLGGGFHSIDDSLTTGVREAVVKGVEATVALDHYHRHENSQPCLVDVMLAANEAHRSFLELDPREGLGLEQLVNNCCRLGSLIYSDMVLFPMPSCTKIKPRLARELRQLLEEFQDLKIVTEDFKHPVSDMVLWVLVMGGIAASFTEHRRWFQDRLRTRLRRTKSDASFSSGTWAEFKRHVSKFLWWDPVVDRPAMELWNEATHELRVADNEMKG
ncbi:uncharacterized protein PV07_05080 [Cladophialophora immunda]|uniref:Uncharacterized protein n=1 Tax=Cladophialophora immunda TaxID=569365 RepID=A0A0D2CGA0_9EURO|nr:uncharacterized protein PV07_05080 [Cladophialophora immunda]KIW29255.1 hypothetical protein PV07_05080 [Cladophialophora immunda]OQV07632.1 hypothetical protein CLAIMM_12037 [Cladophialophora immunda]